MLKAILVNDGGASCITWRVRRPACWHGGYSYRLRGGLSDGAGRRDVVLAVGIGVMLLSPRRPSAAVMRFFLGLVI